MSRRSPRLLALSLSTFLAACGGSGGGTTTFTCRAGEIDCEGRCVDPLTDRAHCGAGATCAGDAAGVACLAGQVCASGICDVSCPGGQVDCGGRCVDPLTDRAHCGASGTCEGDAGGVTCVQGEVCTGGTCSTSCPVGQVVCGGRCVDPATDNLHCGASGTCADDEAGTACPPGQVCGNGSCAPSCPAGQVSCSGRCVDPLSDRAHCGAGPTCLGDEAGATCGGGEVCDRGACALSCQEGLASCGGSCVDPATDRRFCGASLDACAGGVICAAGYLCSGGACVPTCPGDQLACGGRCVDPASDRAYCGAGPDCAGGTACGADAFCRAGSCWSACDPGEAFCGGSCVDPATSHDHCGASGMCEDAAAGAACRPDQVCSGGVCGCPAGRVACGGACIDPQRDAQHCGAAGSCSGAEAGATCGADQVCERGACSTLQDLDWRPWRLHAAPPRFRVEGATPLLAHVVLDPVTREMIDLTGITSWTRVGTPGAFENGMWSPPDALSGPFAPDAYWMGDEATRQYLNLVTAGDFIACARFKPGAHPDAGPNKILFALGKPEAPGTEGWALMQMHDASCFHYHDAAADGEWMAASVWGGDSAALEALEWSWFCGGRDGASLRSIREGSVILTAMAMGGQPSGTPIGPFQPSSVPPTIGAYADGSGALWDGAVYELAILGEPATKNNLMNAVARAAGGLALDNEAPRVLVGADGLLHSGAPGTVAVEPTGDVKAHQRIVLGGVVHADPRDTGVCLGWQATADDWETVVGVANQITWAPAQGSGVANVRWQDAPNLCFNVTGTAGTTAFVCERPPGLAPGSTHTFLFCASASDGKLRMYVDGATTPLRVSAGAVPAAQLPRLDDPSSTLTLLPTSSRLRIHRVFACPTADPAACR